MRETFLTSNNKFVQIIIEPRYRRLRHLLLFLLLLVTFNSTMMTFLGNIKQLGSSIIIFISITQFLLYLSVVYLNIYVFVPRLFMKNRYFLYCVVLLCSLAGLFGIIYWMEYYVHSRFGVVPGALSYINSNHILALDMVSDITVTGMCCIGTTITLLFRSWFTDGRRRTELETEEYRASVSKLKNTVSPGFMSDALLQAADSVCTDADKSADILSRLSRFLRYRLYDSSREAVMLNSEIAFLETYLSIVSRIRGNFTYKVESALPLRPTAIQPSVFMNIIEAVLESIPAAQPLGIYSNFIVHKEYLVFDLTLDCDPEKNVIDEVEDKIEKILTLTYPQNNEFKKTCTEAGPGFSIKINTIQ